MCGGNIKTAERECSYCGTTIVINSIAEINHAHINSEVIENVAEQARKSISQNPSDALAHYQLGLFYLQKRLHEAATTHLRKAADLMPENHLVHYNLAIALFNDGNTRLSSPEYAEGIHQLEITLLLSPQMPEALAYKKAFLARKLDDIDPDAAIKEYLDAISICPNLNYIHNNLGALYLKQNNLNFAQHHLTIAYKLFPGSCHTMINLSVLYTKLNDHQKAIKAGEKAISLGNQTSETMYAMAYAVYSEALWASGKKDEAVVAVRKAIALHQDMAYVELLTKYELSYNNFWMYAVGLIVLPTFFIVYTDGAPIALVSFLVCVILAIIVYVNGSKKRDKLFKE